MRYFWRPKLNKKTKHQVVNYYSKVQSFGKENKGKDTERDNNSYGSRNSVH